MTATDRRMKAARLLTALCLIFIWGNSLLPGELSGAISDWVGEILARIFESTPEDTPGGIPLRKIAHFTEFACLGMLLGWQGSMLGKKPWWAFASGAAAACIDETIQIFVPLRGPGLADVCIDTAGVLTGMSLLYFGHTCFKRIKSHFLEET